MGREFNELFDSWSESYDSTVTGHDPEYIEVFDKYQEILENVANLSAGTVIEFGVGTGNLSEQLMKRSLKVYGMEPSSGMRTIAAQKFPSLTLLDGDFLEFPDVNEPVNTIVSTYAFHHLIDTDKERAISTYSNLLSTGDKIVFADTMFETEQLKIAKIEESKNLGYNRLAHDLSTEYYTTIPVMKRMFEQNGFEVSFKQQNPFVWIVNAVKK